MPESLPPPDMTGKYELGLRIEVTPQNIRFQTLGESEDVHPFMVGQAYGAAIAALNRDRGDIIKTLGMEPNGKKGTHAFCMGEQQGFAQVTTAKANGDCRIGKPRGEQ